MAMRKLMAAGMMVLGVGCGDQSLAPPNHEADSELYWELVVDHPAVLLSTAAPYDTLQLAATPRNSQHEPLLGLPVPVFRSLQPDIVSVSADGKLIAIAPTSSPVTVVASMTSANIKHEATVAVSVVASANPPVLTTFSIHPVPPDSAKLSVGGTTGQNALAQNLYFPARAADADGVPMPVFNSSNPSGILPVSFISQNPSVLRVYASVNQGDYGSPLQVGRADIIGRTTAFGVTKADTVTYRVGLPLLVVARFLSNPPTFTPSTGQRFYLETPTITIGTGGAVGWTLQARQDTDTVAVRFADADLSKVLSVKPVVDSLPFRRYPNATFVLCAFICDLNPVASTDGNFSLSGDFFGSIGGRYFPVPGTYEYTAIPNGSNPAPMTGRVVVVDDSDAP